MLTMNSGRESLPVTPKAFQLRMLGVRTRALRGNPLPLSGKLCRLAALIQPRRSRQMYRAVTLRPNPCVVGVVQRE